MSSSDHYMLRAEQAATTVVDASADTRTAWLFVWGSDGVYIGEKLVLEPSKFEAVSSSVIRQLAHYQPPVLRQHDRDADSYGRVVDARVLTREQAAEHGVRLKTDRALFAKVAFTPVGWALLSEGRAPYTSPGFQLGYTDETRSRTWDAWLHELSLVTVPHQQVSQPPIDETRRIQMALQEAVMEDEEVIDGPASEGEIEDVTQRVATVEARLDRIEEMLRQMAEAQGTGEEMANDEKPDEMAARVQSLELQLKAERARREVEEFARGRALSKEKIDSLIELKVKDDDAYKLATSMLGTPAPRKTERAAQAGEPTPTEPSALHQMARKRQKEEGISYSEAIRLIAEAK